MFNSSRQKKLKAQGSTVLIRIRIASDFVSPELVEGRNRNFWLLRAEA